MMRLAVVFLVIALLAAFFGFGVASYSSEGAKVLFVIFVVLAALFFLAGAFRGTFKDTDI